MDMKTPHVTHQQASGLLHNKFVVVLGSSFQRGVYKDLVLLLQKDNYLSLSQLKNKGEEQFEKDELLEGGRKGQLSNGTQYKEVREYTSDHHLVRFYFITRVYSEYVQRILEDFKNGLKPDLVIVNSCVWDVSRYGRQWEPDYLENLNTFFGKLRTILPDEALIIWNLTMPLGKTIIGGFLVPEIAEFGPSLRFDIIEANYCSTTLASVYGLDVLDLHFQFRFSLQHRMKDGVHWNAVAHRRITCLLLAHVANAWGVELPPSQPPKGLNQRFSSEDVATKAMYQQPRKGQRPVTSWRPKEWKVNYPQPATSWKTPHFYGVTRWRLQERWADCYPLPDNPLKVPHCYGGLNRSFSKQDPATKEMYQQPRNGQNSVTRWRLQERRADCYPLLESPTKAVHCYGGLNQHFSDQYPATMEMYQQPRNAHNSGNDPRMRITRWRLQEKRGDHYLPHNTLMKNPSCYGEPTGFDRYENRLNYQCTYQEPHFREPHFVTRDFSRGYTAPQLAGQSCTTRTKVTRWSFQERRDDHYLPPVTPTKPSHCCRVRHVSLVSSNWQDPATNDVYQQPRNAQNSVTSLRPQKRRADCYMMSTPHPKAPRCYGGAGVKQSFAEQDLATSVMYQQPRNTQDSVTRSSLQERRDDFYLPPATPTKPSRCYGGLNRSFNKQDSAINEVYQQPRNSQNSVTSLRPQKRRADCYMMSTPHLKAPRCYGGAVRHVSLVSSNWQDPATNDLYQQPRNAQNSGVNQSFGEQDLATSVMYQQPRNTQDSVTRSSLQERRDDFYLPPATPTKPSRCYRVLNQSFSREDPATRWISRESRKEQCSEPTGFNRCENRLNYQCTYQEPHFREPHFVTRDFSRGYTAPQLAGQSYCTTRTKDPGFSLGNYQHHSPNDNYVMRNKYSGRAQYRPY
ncbi:uncharacterized protein LOC125289118 isoform X2 [Alosa alosa]|uniref:uncharacterized protein LOC125289118 isoform X2 n=1 Tax=Alosa alosa TaxID=278164 RepID=UPI00201523BA|nr:uncharacterized protein LOC125289118 isoform X2 [Alosa alosa]